IIFLTRSPLVSERCCILDDILILTFLGNPECFRKIEITNKRSYVLLALRLIIQSDETRFKLLSEGPGLLAIKSLEDRLNRIEKMGEQRQISR
ncbi:MAG: hypothetical protein ACRD4W_04405, partial [Nitrososphaeraceae archaeon]